MRLPPDAIAGHAGCSCDWPPACTSRNIGRRKPAFGSERSRFGECATRPGRDSTLDPEEAQAAMYLDLFKLTELPFRLSPDPQFLYLSKQHARAKAYMESTIWFTDGFVVITGEIGAGKTTLIESFLKEIQADVVVAQVNQTQVSAADFLQAVLVQF